MIAVLTIALFGTWVVSALAQPDLAG